VLFTRPSNTKGFAANAHMLSSYLSALITCDTEKQLDVIKLTQTIQLWKDNVLEHLSKMTMDSMYSLYTEFTKYDSRWNEVFMKPLTTDLKKLKVSHIRTKR